MFGCVEPALFRVLPKTTKMLDFGIVLPGLQNSALVTLNNPLRTNAAFARSMYVMRMLIFVRHEQFSFLALSHIRHIRIHSLLLFRENEKFYREK
jgi:hypothetical protein